MHVLASPSIVTGVAAFEADGSAGNFSFGDAGADVVFGSVGVEGNFRPIENAQQSILVAIQSPEQPVEHDVAGCAALEDAVEAGAQDAGLLRAGRPLVLLQATIEPPDHPLGDLDGVALLVVGGKELVDKAFGVNPAQRMDADAELAGVVGNNDGVRQ